MLRRASPRCKNGVVGCRDLGSLVAFPICFLLLALVVSGGFPHTVRVGTVSVLGNPSFSSDVFDAVPLRSHGVSCLLPAVVSKVVSEGMASMVRVCVVDVCPIRVSS